MKKTIKYGLYALISLVLFFVLVLVLKKNLSDINYLYGFILCFVEVFVLNIIWYYYKK